MVITILLDIESAYYRVHMHWRSIGQQALKIACRWMIALALVFGKRRSGEVYPLITAATSALPQFMVPPDPILNGTADFESLAHVDDFAAIEVISGDRVFYAFAALIHAAKMVSGHDAPAENKIVKNGFPAAVHRFLGELIDSDWEESMTPLQQAVKLVDLMAMPELTRPASTFSRYLIAKVAGCFTHAGKSGVLPLAGIRKHAACWNLVSNKKQKIALRPYFDEPQDRSVEKIHRDLDTLRICANLLLANPVIGRVSMMSLLTFEERLDSVSQILSSRFIVK